MAADYKNQTEISSDNQEKAIIEIFPATFNW